MRRGLVLGALVALTAALVWRTQAETTKPPAASAPPSSLASAAADAPGARATEATTASATTATASAAPAIAANAPGAVNGGAPALPESDELEAVRAAIASGGSTDVLVRALDGDDPVAKIEAIDELARRKHHAALPRLLRIDPSADPFVGPTAIIGLGQLARDADPSSREAAVTRLAKLLEAEKARQGMDSPGTILVIVEALGKIGTPSSARVLERELVDPVHPTAARVAIVEALEACGQSDSHAALSAFRASFRPSAAGDAFEREIENDLLATLDRALRTLAR